MRRVSQPSSKPCQDDLQNIHRREFESASATILNTEKLRKIKDIQNETRCHSVRNPVREPKDEPETGRTRSMSPAAHVPPLDAKLPLRKFFKLYSKIVVQLETVKRFTETKTNESENLVDLRRQLQRADEFSIRFSRNNLYETKRIINEIKQLIVPYPFEGLSPGHCRVLCKKIILAFQAATQALQTYINFAKNPSNLEVPEKINELVLLIAELFLCCEHVSLPLNDAYIKHDAVKICNELIGLLKSKLPVCEYVELKEVDLAKNKAKKLPEEGQKMKKLSMYRTKLAPKAKGDVPKKKIGVPCLLGVRNKKPKKDEKNAKLTHEIYTQKLTPWQGRALANKIVKFEAENQEKGENPEDRKTNLRRPKHVTPREVRSQDDDVETMVQTIGDDEVSTWRLSSASRDADDVSEINKTSFKNLLLETIEELQHADKKEQKVTLKKLLNSIQNCSKSQNHTPRPDRVKVYHFLSKDLLEEMENSGKEKEEETAGKTRTTTTDAVAEQEKQETPKKIVPGPRRLNNVFKPLAGKDSEAAEGEAVSRERIKLKLSEEVMNNANKYRKAFSEYRKNNIMYKKTLANTPWELVGKVSDRIILDIIEEIALDFQNDALLRRLYLNELLEVTG